MASNAPLTIQSGNANNFGSIISINGETLSLPYNLTNQYWILVVDRTDLTVKLNINFSTNSAVPAALQPYSGNSQYIMILTTQALPSNNLPTGAFYDYLISEGAGTQLNRLEQIFEALNCGTWGSMSYTLVTVLDGTNSYDYSEVTEDALISTLQLMPVQIGQQVLYTPVEV